MKTRLKDENTTSKRFGYRVTGYALKDDKGEIMEKVYKPYKMINEHNIKTLFVKFLKSN